MTKYQVHKPEMVAFPVTEEQRAVIDLVLHPDIASTVTGWQENMSMAGEEEFSVQLDGPGFSLFVSAQQSLMVELNTLESETGELRPGYRMETPMWKISVEQLE